MILVCGATGLLGKSLCYKLKQNNIKFIGTYNTNKCNNYKFLDFLNINQIENFIKSNNITIIINLIAIRYPNICEHNWKLTSQVNIQIPQNLAILSKKYNIKLIHLSTDYVFDGLNQPNLPDSDTNPLQNYGISKLIGEKRITHFCDKYLIIRVPVLYSLRQNKLKESSVTIIGKKMLNLTHNINENNLYVRRPVNCKDLSNFIISNFEKNGIKHYYNPFDKYTKYSIAKNINQYIQRNDLIADNKESNAIRPFDTQLLDKDNIKYSSNLSNDLKTIFSKYYFPKITLDNAKDFVFLMDLDGTIITEYIHFKIYRDLLKKYDIHLKYEDYLNFTNNSNSIDYIKNLFQNDINIARNIVLLKRQKILNSNYSIDLINNFDKFLEKIFEYKIKLIIVTNSPKSYIDFVKTKIPLLQKISYWIGREDYKHPKPNKEPFEIALKKYGNNEKYILGFENSKNGINSLLQITNLVFGCIKDYDYFNKDIFLYDDYIQILNYLFKK